MGARIFHILLPNVFPVEINRIKKIYDIQPIKKSSIFYKSSVARKTVDFIPGGWIV